VGQGSCFTVWLPLRVAGDAVLALATAPASPHIAALPGGRTALVVEDDFKSADLIRVQLEAEGFTVLHADSGEAALEIVTRQPLSLITLARMQPSFDAPRQAIAAALPDGRLVVRPGTVPRPDWDGRVLLAQAPGPS